MEMATGVEAGVRPANPECGVCAGTGFDLDFGGRCSECWGHAPRQGGIGEVLRERQQGGRRNPDAAPAVRPDDSWKRQIRWTKMGDQFLVLIPKGHGRVAEGDTVTVTSRNGEKQVRLGVCYAPNQYGDLLYWPLRDAEAARAIGVAPTPAAPAEERTNRYPGSCQVCRTEVAAGAGLLLKNPAGKWITKHRDGECAVADPALDAVPAGHYAIPSEGENDLLFVRVDRNEGYPVRVKMIVGGHPDQTLAANRVPGILARIAAAGVVEAATLYCTELERCSHCNRHLTLEESRHNGMGAWCAEKYGFGA